MSNAGRLIRSRAQYCRRATRSLAERVAAVRRPRRAARAARRWLADKFLLMLAALSVTLENPSPSLTGFLWPRGRPPLDSWPRDLALTSISPSRRSALSCSSAASAIMPRSLAWRAYNLRRCASLRTLITSSTRRATADKRGFCLDRENHQVRPRPGVAQEQSEGAAQAPPAAAGS